MLVISNRPLASRLRIAPAEQHETDYVRLRSLRLHCLCGLMDGWHKVDNSNNYFVETTLIHELSFDSEYVKDITSSLPDIFLQKFNYTSIQGGVTRKQFFEAFSMPQASFRAKTRSQSVRHIYEFLWF